MATYKRCCACDYWVTSSDKRCPNCGIPDPRTDRSDTLTMETPMTDGTRAAFGGFIGAVIGGFLMEGMGVAVGVAVGVSLGVLLGADREWGPGEMPPPLSRAKHVASLRHVEDTIQQRLSDIAAREKKLVEVRHKIESEAANMDKDLVAKTRTAVISGAAILARHRERYHAKLWEIALVRWQNGLEPLAGDWDKLTHDECNQRLRQLEAARERGEAYLKEWANVDFSDLPEGQRCVDRLKQALKSCSMLREALIVQQAALAVKGIAPMDDAMVPAMAPTESLKNLDIFNARATLGEFSSAFSELEAEYSRLKSEEELAEQTVLVRRMG